MRRNHSQVFSVVMVLLLWSSFAHAQSWSGIIANSRAEDWGANAGLPANMPTGEKTPNAWTPPTRNTQCVTAACQAVTTNGKNSTPAQINSAIASASSGSYVLLPAGTYTINANIVMYGHNGVTLRGSGPQSTILNLSGANTEVQFGICCTSNSSGVLSAASYAARTTSVTITGVSNAANLVVGNIAWLNQCDSGWSGTGTAGGIAASCSSGSYVDNGGVWICGVDYSQCSTNSVGTGTHNYQQQVVQITSVTNNGGGSYTVGFSPGLYMPNWSSSNNAQLFWQSQSNWGMGMGLEAMTVVISNNTNERVDMEDTYASWVKGVRFIGQASVHGLSLGLSKNNLIMNTYTYAQNPNQLSGPTQEPLGFQNDGDNLILNNIVHGGLGVFGGGTTEGTVMAYGYYFDSQTDNDEEGYFQHYPGSAFTLFEGNETGTMRDDDTHGTHTLNTNFRNYLSGYSAPYQIPNCVAMVIDNFARFDNVIGNVLGGGSGCTAYQSTTGGNGFIYVLSTATDPISSASLMRWGNCDSVTGTCRFQTSEVPTTLSGNAVPFQNSLPANNTLPASFFMDNASAHPSGGTGLSWWKTCSSWTSFPTNCGAYTTPPFPTNGPDVTGGAYVNGHAYDNPAAIAYKNLPVDTGFQNSFTITGSSWTAGVETLNVSLIGITGASTHVMGGFRLSGVNAACLPASGVSYTGRSDGEILMVAPSSTTSINYALPSNPGVSCTGTMLFPDVRQFDERVYQGDVVGNPNGPPPPTSPTSVIR